MYHFATIFDSNFLSRGLALRYSLRCHCQNFSLYILCLDKETFDFFEKESANDTIPIKLCDLESCFLEIQNLKSQRSWAEYIFTLSPIWPLLLFKRFSDIELIITIDADVYFFSNPIKILEKNKNFSILITPHRFSNENKYREIYGKYNVSFQAFRRDYIGLACLYRWKDLCVEWCYDCLEENRFADQKYLDDWREIYGERVVEIDHPGAALAPWNIENVNLRIKEDILSIGDTPLIFFHFHGLRFINNRVFRSGLSNYHVCKNKKFILKHLYGVYIHVIRSFYEESHKMIDAPNIRNHSHYTIKEVFKMFIYGKAEFYVSKSLVLCVNSKK